MEKEAVEEEALARDNAGWEAASAARSRADDACSTARRSAQRVQHSASRTRACEALKPSDERRGERHDKAAGSAVLGRVVLSAHASW